MNITENLEIEETALLEDRPGNDQSRQPRPFTRSLRSKVYIFIVPVLEYMVSISVFFFSQRDQPLQQLEQYKKYKNPMKPWSGKVRELQNALVRSLILSENGIIDTCDLPHNIGTHQNAPLNKAGNGYDTLKQQLRNYELVNINTAIEDAKEDRKLVTRKFGKGVSSLYRKLEM